MAKEPVALHEIICKTIFMERRHPHVGKFYSNAKGKFGRQKIGNGLGFFNAIKEDWLRLDIGDDTLRLKKK
jgi:hypothetical protein